jgi:predicted RNA-binding Zn ribbon-like protein
MAWASYANEPPKLVAGCLSLDFLNTVEWRADPECRSERLVSYSELLAWLKQTGHLAPAEVKILGRRAREKPVVARRVLKEAIEAREAMAQLALSKSASMAAVSRLNAILSRTPSLSQIEVNERRELGIRKMAAAEQLGLPLVRILDQLARDLPHLVDKTVSTCANPRCGWFFLDNSRNRTRRWCQMNVCGNRSKAHKHYKATKTVGVSPVKQ